MKKKLLVLSVAILMSVCAVIYAQASVGWVVTANCFTCPYTDSYENNTHYFTSTTAKKWAIDRGGLKTTHTCSDGIVRELSIFASAKN